MFEKFAEDVTRRYQEKLAEFADFIEKLARANAGNIQPVMSLFRGQPTTYFGRLIKGMQNGSVPYTTAAPLYHNNLMKDPQLANTSRTLGFDKQIMNILNNTNYQQGRLPNIQG